jgi:hypothetical protein
MVGKYLRRGAIIDLKKSEERANAIRKRKGLEKHPVRAVVCGCPDPKCGGWHDILPEPTIPSNEECAEILKSDNRARKVPRKRRGA